MMKKFFSLQPSASKTRGFTLMEVLLYLAIFSVTIGSVVGLSHLALSQRVKNQVTADVNYQAEAVMASMIQTIQAASSITAPSLGASSSSLTLAMASAAVNPTIYDAYDEGSTTRIRLREGNPAVQNYLTNSHVRVSNISFINAGLAGSKGSIKIQFDLIYKNPGNREEYNFSKTFYGTANVR